jgi:hypothetical protein
MQNFTTKLKKDKKKKTPKKENTTIPDTLVCGLCHWPQVLPCPQLIFPSKTWVFGNLFEFSKIN